MSGQGGIRPLGGVKVVEFEGSAPPLCGSMLAGLGAEVTLVARPVPPDARRVLKGAAVPPRWSRSTASAWSAGSQAGRGVAAALELVAGADVLIEGLRRAPWSAGPRAGRVPCPQPAHGLRPHDGMGAERPAGPQRRP